MSAVAAVQIKLLGPVEVVCGHDRLNPGAPQQRAVLAALAVDAGRLVTEQTLIDRVWGDAPPRAVRSAIHANATLIRRLLNTVSSHLGNGSNADSPAPVLARRANGYVLDVEPGWVDLHRFGSLVTDARGRDDDAREAMLHEALGLWQGQALAGLPGPWAERMRQSWHRLRLDAQVEWADVGLRLARHQQVINALRPLVDENSLVEPLVAVLMRALAAAGRLAEALDCYTTTRRRLDDELGITPGPQLQALHQAIMCGNLDQILSPAQAATAPAAGGPAPATVPRQLPTAPPHFVGRAAQLAALERLADRPAEVGAVTISAVAGMAGVGKTALALHAAHRLAGRFPDGQLYIDLRGFTAGVARVEPAEALDRLLREVGVAWERIPGALEERAALWRSTVAQRRMLILLDNAATEAQVGPLLPGAAGCLVLVTSRRRLTALETTHAMSLDMLPETEAAELFVSTADRPDLSEDGGEVLEAVRLCGCLPLAIRIAAARLRHRPVWTVTDVVERLRRLESRLSALDDGHRSVSAALHLSYQHLSVGTRRTYRLLGLLPGPDIEPYAAAALTEGGVAEVKRWLDQLVDDHLLAEPTQGRYRWHDLVRAHAAQLAVREENHAQRRDAMAGLLDFYRHTTTLAMHTAYPYVRARRLLVTAARPGTPLPPLPDAASALRWLDTELPNLLAAARYAAHNGQPQYVWQVSTLLQRHMRIRGRYREAETLHQQALDLACAAGNQRAEAEAHIGLGDIHRMLGNRGRATENFRRALKIADSTGDSVGQLDAHLGLGDVSWFLGDYERAAEHFRQALQLAHAIGDRVGQHEAHIGLGDIDRFVDHYEQAAGHYRQAWRIACDIEDRSGERQALANLGSVLLMQDRHEQAADHFERALRLAREIGDRSGERHALAGLGNVHQMLGRYGQAADHFKAAWQIAKETGGRIGELQALSCLGLAYRLLCRHSESAACYQRLLDLADELGSGNYRFEAAQGLGRLRLAGGQPELALAHHQQALRHATALAQQKDVARAHDGLAHAYYALDDPAQARRHWQHALDILTGLGSDQTDEAETSAANLRAHLARMS